MYWNKNVFNDTKENPFTLECPYCIKDIWNKLKEKTDELDTKSKSETHIWIEKFQDDNY